MLRTCYASDCLAWKHLLDDIRLINFLSVVFREIKPDPRQLYGFTNEAAF